MKRKDKELLLKDISARLPYNVKVDITYSNEHGSSDRLMICSEGCLILNTDILGLCIEEEIYIKPYLRPMSSMTEEEISDLQKINSQFNFDKFDNFAYVGAADDGFCSVEEMCNILNYLNFKHLDYRGMIPMNLAIEAPEGMYNIN